MAHKIEERDIQAGLAMGWHQLTTIVDKVTRENSMPFEVKETPIFYKAPVANEAGVMEDTLIEHPSMRQLLADDDWGLVGPAYDPKSYFPSSIKQFWEVIEQGLGSTPYVIHSAGTVQNRQKLFASLKLSDGFRIGDREFKDFITIIDSFDKTMAFQTRYSNICVVCANTFQAVMEAGTVVGKAKHTFNLENNLSRLIAAIDQFCGTSREFENLLNEANQAKTSRDEAKAWLTGLEGRNMKEPTNGLMEKSARMVELFEHGKGNTGETRLDAFQAYTEYHTHYSSNRKDDSAQYSTSEWGTSAASKTLAVDGLSRDWNKYRQHGEKLLLAQ